MLTILEIRDGETHVYKGDKYFGAWLGKRVDVKRLVKLANEDEERECAKAGTPCPATEPLFAETQPQEEPNEPVSD